MSEKMRDEFESWCAGKLNIDGCDEFYFNANTNLAWVSWKASRAALACELPSDISGEYCADGWNAALMRAEERLKEAGISCK